MGGIDNAVVPSVCLVAFFAFLFSVSEGGKKRQGEKGVYEKMGWALCHRLVYFTGSCWCFFVVFVRVFSFFLTFFVKSPSIPSGHPPRTGGSSHLFSCAWSG